MDSLKPLIDKAAVLIEALPYIQCFSGCCVVVKYGGSTIGGGDRIDTVLRDLVFMEIVGIHPVIVHGGGPAINRRLAERGVASRRVNGLRVTDEDTMKVVEETLFGEVNAAIVETIQGLGGHAVGISACDAQVLHVRRHLVSTPEGPVDIGFVGEVERVDPDPVKKIVQAGGIPVVAPLGRGQQGNPYNVNADTAAGEIAVALGAEKLVFLTDVTGIMRDPTDRGSLLSTIQLSEIGELLAAGIISGGMIPKIEACVRALEAGVSKTHVIDGRMAHAILLEFFTDEGIGTQIVR